MNVPDAPVEVVASALAEADGVLLLFACLGVDVAHRGDYLRRALHHEHAAAAYAAYGSHVLAFRREGQLRLDVLFAAQCLIVYAVLVEPQQQGNLRGVANALAALGVEVCRCVQRDGRAQQFVVGVVGLKVGHLHLVLRQRARLVGADHGHGAHRFARVQLAHEVVVLQHAAHVERQAQRHGHRHALGHGHDDKRYGHHEVLQHDLGHAQVVG